MNLAPAYLSYLFKKETGANLVKYITDYRMEQARKLQMCIRDRRMRGQRTYSLICGHWAWTPAVSYTHLDVYKRQLIVSAKMFAQVIVDLCS